MNIDKMSCRNISLKQKLINKQLTIGSWVTIGHISVVEIMLNAGLDWLTFDLEHSSIELETLQNLITLMNAKEIPALVRVSSNNEVIIKRVMDIGADGVIVPMVNSEEDAVNAVNYVKYPPKGKRGVGLYRAQSYGNEFLEYKEWVEKYSIVIPQIEHIKAVNNIDKILQVEGVDGIIIGPYDLSASMGYPGEYERQDVKEAIQKVKESCNKHNKSLGFHVIEPDNHKLKIKIDEGYNFLAFSLDFFFLGNKLREELAKISK